MATKLSAVRQLHSDFARAYKYDFIMVTTPAVSKNFKTTFGSSSIKEALRNSCLNVVVPGEGVQLIDVEVGSHTMKLHGRKEKGGTISPEFLLTGDYAVYKWFREWTNAANPDSRTSNEVQAFSSDLLATVQISAKNVANSSSIIIQLDNVWCRNSPELNFADDSNDIIRWAPELVYEFSTILDGTTLSSIT